MGDYDRAWHESLKSHSLAPEYLCVYMLQDKRICAPLTGCSHLRPGTAQRPHTRPLLPGDADRPPACSEGHRMNIIISKRNRRRGSRVMCRVLATV